jgi:SAM-dependent methyltransferase
MKRPNPLSLYERLYIRLFYWRRLHSYDLPENQVGWRSRQSQEARFESLIGVGDLNGKKILDLGCGLGCFYGYLRASGWQGEYRGLDILGSMVRRASRRFPQARFEQRDILRDPLGEKWDYVFLCGVLNHKIRDNWGWMEAMVVQSLALAKKGIAFNLLTNESAWPDEDLFYVDLGELEKKAALWSGGKYKIVRGYLPEDVTVFLYSGGG